MKIIKLLSSEDAVSEVVDFVTLLGILVISIGLIGVAGYPIVKNVQEANYIENTKQSFIVLAENVNKVVMGQAPSQSVELKMYGGTLNVNASVNDSSTITITTGQNILLVDDQPMGSIESTVGDTVIAYEGTGVWERYPNGNTLLVSKPLITNLSNVSNVLVIPVVTIIGASSIGGTGMGWVNVCEPQGCAPSSVNITRNVSNINVTINSSYSDGWYNYFSKMSWNCIPSVLSVTCTTPLNAKNVDVYILNVPLDTGIV
jgi:hypothetical protein